MGKMISVCMAVFNGERYVHEQVTSILKQLSSNDELIVSDDFSTDGTLAVIRAIDDDRIKVISNSMCSGYSGNFENAIKLALGDYIFLSDQDDVWVEGKVNKMCEALESAELVVSDALFVDGNLVSIGKKFFSLRGVRKGFFQNIYKSRYLGACMAFRREILTKLLPFPGNKLLCPHDLWITIVSELYFRVEIIDEPLILYRRHGNNVSNGGFKSGNGFFYKIKFRLYSIFKVIGRVLR